MSSPWNAKRPGISRPGPEVLDGLKLFGVLQGLETQIANPKLAGAGQMASSTARTVAVGAGPERVASATFSERASSAGSRTKIVAR